MKTIVYMSLALLALGLAGEFGLLGGAPSPSNKQLRSMVTRGQASELKQFYAALATVVGSPTDIRSTGDFRDVQALGVKILQENSRDGMKGLERLNRPISDRLVEAIGNEEGEVPDVPLNASLRSKLQKALDNISAEF